MDLSKNDVTKLYALASLTNLTHLNLSCNRISSLGMLDYSISLHQKAHYSLTLSMVRLYFQPKHKDAENFENHLKPCHVGIHWIALT